MTQEFIKYIGSKGLEFQSGTESEQSLFAIVSPQPNLSDFTQVTDKGKGRWEVRLSKKDLRNDLITKGFFQRFNEELEIANGRGPARLSTQQPKTKAGSKPLHHQLNGWDGYSERGEAIYDAMFEQEKAQELEQDCIEGICTCCKGSMYYGM